MILIFFFRVWTRSQCAGACVYTCMWRLGIDNGCLFSAGLNKNGPHKLIHLNADSPGPRQFESIGRIRRCGLATGSVALGVGFDVSKIQAR